jgi:putative MFS transporter
MTTATITAATPSPDKNENNIYGRIERLPLCRAQWKLWSLHAICWALGHFGLATATFTLVPIGAEFGMDLPTKGLVASVMFLGMFVGAGTSGYLGDRFGRKKMLLVSIAIWCIGAFILAWSPGESVFFIGRFIIGLGVGAQLPISQSMLSELFPAPARGRAICLAEGGYPLMCLIVGVVSWALLMFFDWREVFFVQGLAGLCAFFVALKIPESARWLEMVGRVDEAKAIVTTLEQEVIRQTKQELPPIPAPIVEPKDTSGKSKLAQLFARDQIRKTLTLWILWFCVLFGYYGLNTWIAALLVDSGFGIVQSNGFVILMYLPAIPGFLSATYLVEKLGRKKMIFGYLILAAFFCYLYGSSTTFTQVIAFGCCMQFFMFGLWSLIYTYAAEVFPTRIRSTGCGTTSSSGRLAALIAPTLFGALIPLVGQGGLFYIGASVFVVGALVIIIFGVETKGRSLEEI